MKVLNQDGKTYRIPNALNAFQKKLYVHLIDWKRANISEEVGFNQHKGELIPYDAILPDDMVRRKEMPHLYPATVPHLTEHRERNPFRIHLHFYHMGSSQAANISLFLPMLHHPQGDTILERIKDDFASLATDQLDKGYCLEFWGGNYGKDKSGTGPLGDKSAWAGTDSDIAIAYRNHQGELCLWLIEHKLTEREFTDCGGFKSNGREVCHDCNKNFAELVENPSVCYYHDVRRFNYWRITERHRNLFVNHADHASCPFRGGMNQLWRNQLLACAIEQDEQQPYQHVFFSVVRHPRNRALDKTIAEFDHLLDGSPKFSSFTSSDVMNAAIDHTDDRLVEWVRWYRGLYDV